ncbi:hypothetical protein A1D25_04570 [Ursidibacter arcticus]|nr:hypothetical protein A1D25_04570 [Ursidibacter arcticus]
MDKPITEKSLEVRMGQGNVEYWVALIHDGNRCNGQNIQSANEASDIMIPSKPDLLHITYSFG